MAKKRRAIRGAGSVYQRKDGRYAAEIKLDGKTRTFYGKTEKEAYAKMQQAVYEHKQGTLVTGPQQTVEQYLEYWLEDVYKASVRLSTYGNGCILVYKHLIPGLGHIKLQKLTAQQVPSLWVFLQKWSRSFLGIALLASRWMFTPMCSRRCIGMLWRRWATF